MRFLVFSDTHGYIDSCISAVNRIKGVDMILHAGDVSSDAEDLVAVFPQIPVRYVCGNCEFSRVSADELFSVSEKKFFLTHGHCYNVKYENSYSTLLKRARALGADIAVFGHTHKPLCENLGDIWLLNPGSARYGATCGVIELEGDKLRASVIDI